VQDVGQVGHHRSWAVDRRRWDGTGEGVQAWAVYEPDSAWMGHRVAQVSVNCLQVTMVSASGADNGAAAGSFLDSCQLGAFCPFVREVPTLQ